MIIREIAGGQLVAEEIFPFKLMSSRLLAGLLTIFVVSVSILFRVIEHGAIVEAPVQERAGCDGNF